MNPINFKQMVTSIEYTVNRRIQRILDSNWEDSYILWLIFSALVIMLVTWSLHCGSSLLDQDLQTIAVMMIAYPGASCIGAVETAINEATYPQRLSFFIAHAGSDMSVSPAFFSDSPFSASSCLKGYDDDYVGSQTIRDHIDLITMSFSEHLGVNVVKSEFIKEYNGRLDFDFVLEIHAHSLFASHWDEDVISEWLEIGDTKSILTTYPSRTSEMSAREFDHHHGKLMNIICGSKFVHKTGVDNPIITYDNPWEITPPTTIRDVMGKRHMVPIEVPFWSSFFSFGPFRYVLDVPYDPNLKAMVEEDGTEFLYSARLRTNGYKMFAPFKDLVYHNYNAHRYERSQFVKHRGSLQEDLRRIDSLLRQCPVEGHGDSDPFGMGSEMALSEYLRIVEVDLERNIGSNLCEKIKRGHWMNEA